MTYSAGGKKPLLPVLACLLLCLLFVIDSFAQPVIYRFSPQTASTGDTVRIYGSGFTWDSRVMFGDMDAKSFSIVNDTTIAAVVGAGSSGKVLVKTYIGTGSLSGFTFKQLPPVLTWASNFEPVPGEPFYIYGKNFLNGVVSVSCRGMRGTVMSDDMIYIEQNGEGSYPECSQYFLMVMVETPGGKLQEYFRIDTSSHRWMRVDSMSTLKGGQGTVVELIGENLQDVTMVNFSNPITGSNNATIVSAEYSRMKVLLNNNATWGKLSVFTNTSHSRYDYPKLTLSVPSAPPYLSFAASNRFDTKEITRNAVVTLAGANLGTANKITLGGEVPVSFTVINDSKIELKVGRVKNYKGAITVYTDYGRDSIWGMKAVDPLALIGWFRPETGKMGDTITVYGDDVDYAADVQFGGTSVASFYPVSESVLKAIVGPGSTGVGLIKSSNGGSSRTFSIFTFIPPAAPEITSFSPEQGTRNDMVTIKGAGFKAITAVSIGGIPASYFWVDSESSLRARPGKGRTTNNFIIVTNVGGADTIAGFTLRQLPAVDSIVPRSAHMGDTILIYGTGFMEVNGVYTGYPIKSVPAYRVYSDTFAKAVMGFGNNGFVLLASAYGGDSLHAARFSLLPEVKSFLPQSGGPGTTVTVKGNFVTDSYRDQVERVSIGGEPASFKQLDDSTLTAVVGDGATGPVTVKLYNENPVSSSATFNFIRPSGPVVESFTPSKGYEDDSVTVKGSGFTWATSAAIGGVPVKKLYIYNDSTIGFRAGAGATGTIKIETKWGDDTSRTRFTFLPKHTILEAFYPTSAKKGDMVMLFGRNLNNVVSVYFGGIPADSFKIIGSDTIKAWVGNARSGDVMVDALAGPDSLAGFSYVIPVPEIYSFSPRQGKRGSVITITGVNLDKVTSVGYASHSPASFVIKSSTKIEAVVGDSSAGLPVVWVSDDKGGYDSMGTFTWLPPAPQITSYSPAQIKLTDSLYIHGRNLNRVTGVLIGGFAAGSFRTISDTVIVAILGQKRTGLRPSIVVVSSSGNDTARGLYYLRPPLVDFLNSYEASVNETVQMNGENFTGVTGVYLGSAPALSFTIENDQIIRAVVGSGANGPVKVVGTYGFDTTREQFSYITPEPTIRGFYPQSAQEGDSIWVYGARFRDAASVTIGGVPAAATRLVSDSFMIVYVGKGASGNIEVTTSYGTGSLEGFVFTGPSTPPVISSFTPASGYCDDSVTVKGTGFTGAIAASIGGVPVEYLYVYNDSTIGFHVGVGAAGPVRIITLQGADTSSMVFTYLYSVPHMNGFTPASAKKGQRVRIYGSRLVDVSAVYFGGVPADSFHVSYSYIDAWPGVGGSGHVKVVSLAGIDSIAGFTFIPSQPEIRSVAPMAGRGGDTVRITGNYFTGASAVHIGGNTAGILSISDTAITVRIANNAYNDASNTSAYVIITTAGGKDTALFVMHFRPVVSSVSPSIANENVYITIKGLHLTGTSAVSFGNVPAKSFNVLSDVEIQAIAGNGATGKVKVVTPWGTDTSASFIYQPAPLIMDFLPATAKVGDTINIYGKYFLDIRRVYVGMDDGYGFRVVNDSLIKKVILPATGDGPVYVYGQYGADTTTARFVFDDGKPQVTSFSAASGYTGDTIVIKGLGFSGATRVAIGSVSVQSFYVLNDSTIWFRVPQGATGRISVTTPAGTATSASSFVFTVPVPRVTSFAPTRAGKGDSVMIYGDNLRGVTGVTFGIVAADSFRIVSDAAIKAWVGNGRSGFVRVMAGGRADSLSGFTWLSADTVPVPSAPQITSFNTASGYTGYIGDTVLVKGHGFMGATKVAIGTIPVQPFFVVNDSLIWFRVVQDATGRISVTTPAGTGTSAGGFVFVIPSPDITSFTPTRAGKGDSVIIYGRNLRGVTGITFGMVAADSFRIVSDAAVKAWVGNGRSGFVRVMAGGSADSLSGFTWVIADTVPVPSAPQITGFTPATAKAGDSILIYGKQFTDIINVWLGSDNGTGFRVVNDTLIKKVVQSVGSNGYITVYGRYGADTSATRFVFDEGISQITSFSPVSGYTGDTVLIKGRGFSGAISVTIGAVPVQPFYVINDSTIWFRIGQNANGRISVTTPAGTGTSAGGFVFVIPSPDITSFTPTRAGKGDSVMIYGRNFRAVTGITFGTVAADSFRIVSDVALKAWVGNGRSGFVRVIAGGSADSLSGFTWLSADTVPVPSAPQITGFTPATAKAGDSINIYGKQFIDITNVWLGSDNGMGFRVVNDTLIKKVVQSAASNGYITVYGHYGADTSATRFVFDEAKPKIVSFSPVSGYTGDTVLVKGRGFSGATSVTIGAASVRPFYVINDSTIWFRVGQNANGRISITTSAGTGASTGGFAFVIPAPDVTSFTPTRAGKGDSVMIYGRNFRAVTGIAFGTVAADSFRIVSDVALKAWVGNGRSGFVRVMAGGSADSLSGFTWLSADTVPVPSAPQITSFAPTAASPGKTVVIRGAYFKNVIAVRLGDALATSFTVVADSVINAVLSGSANNHTGSIVVTTTAGKDTAYGFTVLPPSPVVTSLSPSAATLGETVIIRGTALAGASGVRFGNRPAASFVVISATQINAVVDSGATGKVTVITPNGVDTSALFTYVQPAPAVSRFAPKTAITGDTVNIYGRRFNTTVSVKFGAVEAQSYEVVNDTLIKAVVGLGASGNVTVITRFGTAQVTGFIYPGLPPVVYDFTPKSGARGDVIKIRGTRFSQTTEVMLGNFTPASFVVESDSIISATIGDGDANAGSQLISVVTPGGTAKTDGFTYINAGTFNLSRLMLLPGNEKVHVSWQTNGEKYTDHFRLTWTAGTETVLDRTIPAAGFSDTAITYSFMYPVSQSGKNVLQLRTYDKMGNERLADTASFIVDAEVFAKIGSYPNPAVNSTTVQHPATAGSAVIMMFNMRGTMVLTQTVKPGDVQTVVRFNALPQGMYKLVWTNGSTSKSTTIMLQ